jgi:hypothetical protein
MPASALAGEELLRACVTSDSSPRTAAGYGMADRQESGKNCSRVVFHLLPSYHFTAALRVLRAVKSTRAPKPACSFGWWLMVGADLF